VPGYVTCRSSNVKHGGVALARCFAAPSEPEKEGFPRVSQIQQRGSATMQGCKRQAKHPCQGWLPFRRRPMRNQQNEASLTRRVQRTTFSLTEPTMDASMSSGFLPHIPFPLLFICSRCCTLFSPCGLRSEDPTWRGRSRGRPDIAAKIHTQLAASSQLAGLTKARTEYSPSLDLVAPPSA
jgi:hypothetical protein